MELRTKAFNQTRDLERFVKEEEIKRENIVNVFQNADKEYILIYLVDE